MALTVQQFDLIASHQGIQAALAVAEQYGGVTGSREAAVSAPPGEQMFAFGGDPNNLVSQSWLDTQRAAQEASWRYTGPGSTGTGAGTGTGSAQEGLAAPTEAQTIAAWINELITGRTGLGINAGAVNPVTTESLIKSLSARLGRVVSATEFNSDVLPSIPQEWQPTPTRSWEETPADAGFPTGTRVAGSGGVNTAGGGATGVAGTIGLLGGGNVNILGDDLATGGVTPLQMTRPSLERQPQEDIYRRLIQERFGPRTALQARIGNSFANEYEAVRPILDFGLDPSGLDRAAGFRKFLNSPRPTGQQLGQNLAKIMATGDPDTIEGSFAPRAMLSARTNESGEVAPLDFGQHLQDAFSTGIQPYVQRLSPFVRAGVARAIEDRFRQMFANDPTQFQGAGDVFRGLQRRNYIPRWNNPPGASAFSGNLFGG